MIHSVSRNGLSFVLIWNHSTNITRTFCTVDVVVVVVVMEVVEVVVVLVVGEVVGVVVV